MFAPSLYFLFSTYFLVISNKRSSVIKSLSFIVLIKSGIMSDLILPNIERAHP